MKITRIETHLLSSPLAQPFGFSQMYYETRANLLVEVVAEDGTVGWGECFGPARPAQAAIEDCIRPLAVGMKALETERIWHRVWQQWLDHARGGPLMAGLSGLDIALWDLKGKLLGQPLHRLLGGARTERVPCYATGHYFRRVPEDHLIRIILDEARGHLDAGFVAVKLKVGKNLDFDLRVIGAAREALPAAGLMADANHAYNLREATQVGRELQASGFVFFEEPLAPHALEEYARLRERLDVPLAAGESEQTRWGFRRVLEAGAIDIAQPDLAFCGGVSEGLKVRAMANAFGVDVTPHAWGTPVGFAAAAHFHATAPPNPGRLEGDLLHLECDHSDSPVRDQCFPERVEVRDGHALLTDRPGLGIEVDREAVAPFAAD
jgi:D-galactarolactone cycloisomerase